MTQKSKIIVVFGAIVLVGAALVGVSVANDNAKQSAQTVQTEQKKQTEVVTYRGEEGKTALAILKSSHEVGTKTFDGIGEMVTSIDGVEPDSNHFWAFYVNDKQAEVGAGQYQTKDGDTVTWKLEKIN